MFTHQQTSSLISEYVLDLLPALARQEMETHLAACTRCRAAVQQERALARTVRDTVAAATQPAPGRLAQLMPAPPVPRKWPLSNLVWRPAAALCLLLTLFLGTLSLQPPGRDGLLPHPSASALAVTATNTPTSTATARRQAVENEPVAALAPPLARPAGTPLAALYTSNQ